MESMWQLNQPFKDFAASELDKTNSQSKIQDPEAFAAACQKAGSADTAKESRSFMSLEQYKAYIYDKISKIPLNPSKNNWDIFVFISEEGFEAMKNNPEYEKWVLNTIRNDFFVMDPFHSNTTEILKFGAAKEEYKGESYTMPSKKDIERAREEYWERKEAINKRLKKIQDRKRLLEKWYKQDVETKYCQLKRLDHAHQIQEANRALRFGSNYGMEDHSASIYAAAKRKAKLYEASFLYYGL